MEWIINQDTWTYAKAPASLYPNHLPLELQATGDQLLLSIPIAFALTLIRIFINR